MKGITKIWFLPGLLMAAFAMVLILLMVVGNSTEEWTCHCKGPDHWQCKSASCQADATAHFDATRHTVSCKRTEWPVQIIDRVFQIIFPGNGA